LVDCLFSAIKKFITRLFRLNKVSPQPIAIAGTGNEYEETEALVKKILPWQ
jgi:hypothetical protein